MFFKSSTCSGYLFWLLHANCKAVKYECFCHRIIQSAWQRYLDTQKSYVLSCLLNKVITCSAVERIPAPIKMLQMHSFCVHVWVAFGCCRPLNSCFRSYKYPTTTLHAWPSGAISIGNWNRCQCCSTVRFRSWRQNVFTLGPRNSPSTNRRLHWAQSPK